MVLLRWILLRVEWHGVVLYSAVHNSTTQHNTTQHNTTQHNTTQYNTEQYNTIQYSTVHYSTLQQMQYLRLVPRNLALSSAYSVDTVRRTDKSLLVSTSRWNVACCCTRICTYTKPPVMEEVEDSEEGKVEEKDGVNRVCVSNG
jgi:hypothetical protein